MFTPPLVTMCCPRQCRGQYSAQVLIRSCIPSCRIFIKVYRYFVTPCTGPVGLCPSQYITTIEICCYACCRTCRIGKDDRTCSADLCPQSCAAYMITPCLGSGCPPVPRPSPLTPRSRVPLVLREMVLSEVVYTDVFLDCSLKVVGVSNSRRGRWIAIIPWIFGKSAPPGGWGCEID